MHKQPYLFHAGSTHLCLVILPSTVIVVGVDVVGGGVGHAWGRHIAT